MICSFFQDYELQILTYKALQDPISSPLKKRKMESASDNIIQEVGSTTGEEPRREFTCYGWAAMCFTVINNTPKRVFILLVNSSDSDRIVLSQDAVKYSLLMFMTVRNSEDPLQWVDDLDQPVHQVHHRNTAPPGGGRGNSTQTPRSSFVITYFQNVSTKYKYLKA